MRALCVCLQRSAARLLAGAGDSLAARGSTPQAWLHNHSERPPLSLDDISAANEELNQAFGPLDSAQPKQHKGSSRELRHGKQHQAAAAAASGAAVSSPRLTHVDDKGNAHMVDVSGKLPTARTARASCVVRLGAAAFPLVQQNRAAKGDVLATAQLAGIMAAKQTANLIPLCHNIPLSKVGVSLTLDPSSSSVHVSAHASTVGATGVEMEALTAASVAALTVYDMCKAAAKDIVITDLMLEEKTGGKSKDYRRSS